MDQVKFYLRQAVKYRFWIALGLSAIFPLVAVLAGTGAVRDAAKKKSDEILSADKNVKQYTSGPVINGQYQPIVAAKNEILAKDVLATWKKLYARQAPLLDWPEVVDDRFRAWGRKWPETTDPAEVQAAINDYVNAYPDYVTLVYKTFKPFDYEKGDGLVVAPPKEALLRPAVFEVQNPPKYGKVWDAQQLLWIQRTLLDVVDQVNKDAKDWDTAPIRQINAMEVASPIAQDQRSIAKGEALKESEEVLAPGEESSATASESGDAGMAGMAAGEGGVMGGYGGGRGMMMGSGGMMGGNSAAQTIMYLDLPSEQYIIVPVHMSVMIEQDKIPDFLVALENSPMSIQVLDYEQSKPAAPISKPEKGMGMPNFGSYGSDMMMSGMGGMGGYMMGGGGMPGSGYGMMGGGMPGMGGYGMMGGGGMPGSGYGMGGMMGGAAAKKGTDVRSTDREKERLDREKTIRKAAPQAKMFNPYYNVVQVAIYGQARFYNAPPPDAPAEESNAPAETTPTEGAETPKAETTPAPAEAATPADPAKGEPAPPEPKAEPAKEEPKAAEHSKEEPAKTETPREEPKAEPAPPQDPAKDAPKSEPAKGDEPKGNG